MVSLSIIIPVYNVEKYLEQCLDSVLVDNGFTGQVICVNDGSTDGSGEILEEYAKKYPNVEVYAQENQGQSVARNIGLDKATGDYVLFLDSDDYYTPDAITYISQLVDSNQDVDYFYTDCAQIVGSKQYYELVNKEPIKMSLVEYYDYEHIHLGANPKGCVWVGIYKRDFIERNHLRMLPGCRYEDELFVFQVFLQEGICMAVHVERPYYCYRIGRDGATTSLYTLQHFFDRRKIVKACYDAMQKAEKMTVSRKYVTFRLCEENVLEAYRYGFKKDISTFFGRTELNILQNCATSELDKKICRIAAISPRFLAAYRTNSLPIIVRKFVNRFL